MRTNFLLPLSSKFFFEGLLFELGLAWLSFDALTIGTDGFLLTGFKCDVFESMAFSRIMFALCYGWSVSETSIFITNLPP